MHDPPDRAGAALDRLDDAGPPPAPPGQSVRSTLSVLVYPLQLLRQSARRFGIDWFRESLSTRRELQEENASLRTQQMMLRSRLQKLESLEAENLRLRALLDSSFQVGKRRCW